MGRRQKELKHPRALRMLSKILAFMTTMIFTPGFFLVQMATVDFGLFNQMLICYLFMNLYVNMLLSIITDTTTRLYTGDGEECPKCRLPRPLGVWHCQQCDVCILGCNHHCTFLTHCVGRYNYRYYICFLGHFTALMVYLICFYSHVVAENFEISSFKRVLLSLHYYHTHAFLIAQYHEGVDIKKYPEPLRPEDILLLYVVYLCINCTLFLCAVSLFYHHFRNVITGATSYEYAKKVDYVRRHWKTNIVNRMGTKWYLAVLWPFVRSPLPNEKLSTCPELYEINELNT